MFGSFRFGSSKSKSSEDFGSDKESINGLFERYHDEEDTEVIMSEGIIRLCEDLDIDVASDVEILYLAWKCKAAKGAQLTREEFMTGMLALGCDSIEGIKQSFEDIRKEVEDSNRFRDFYRFAFQFSRDGIQKNVETDVVIALLRILLANKTHIESICEFLEQSTHPRITLDQWNNFLEFSNQIDATLSNYDADGAWPLLLDEYVDWARHD